MQDWIKKSGREIAMMAGLAALCAWFGVYGTGRMPFLPRFGLWFMTMVVGYGSAYLVMPLIVERFGKTWPVPLRVFAIAALISVPITLSLMVISSDPWSFVKFYVQYGYVLVVSIVFAGLNFAIEGNREGDGDVGDVASDPMAAFLERLPVKYRTAKLYAVSAEDHYLRVHTSLGEELILMRLADALRELSGADGLQTHGSWWVARQGVADARREDGKQILVLHSGAQAAVSRTYAGDVKQAGLI